MIYLILATLSSSAVSIIMRISEKYSRNSLSLLAVNYLTCGILGAFYTGSANLFPAQDGLVQTLLLGVLGGVLFLASFALLQVNISKNGVLLPTMFMKLGIIIPTLLSIFVFGEQPRIVQLLGIALSAVAIVIMNSGGTTSVKSGVGLLLLLIVTGFSNAMSKIFEEIGHAAFSDHFLFYIFTTAFLLCVGVCLIRGQRFTAAELLWGVCIGLPNYYSTRFMLLALRQIPATIAYPSYSVASIVLVALTGMVCFKEKIGKRRLAALGVILIALAMLNIK